MHTAKKIGFIITFFHYSIVFTMYNAMNKNDVYAFVLNTISDKDENLFRKTICKFPDIIDYVGDDQLPLLHYILHYCGFKHSYLSSRFLKIALEIGADPNITNRHGQTPLHIASSIEHVSLLLQFKANPNIKDKEGRTPLLWQIHNLSFKKTIDFNESDYNPHPIITSLILADADTNTPNNKGITPLHMAIMTINTPAIRILLKCKTHFGFLFTGQKKVSYIKKHENGSEMVSGTLAEMIRDISSIRRILEPYFQKYLSLVLYSNDKDKVAEFMNNCSWIDYTINKEPIAVWINKNCRSKNGQLLHSVCTFYQCLNKALFKADVQETKRLLKAGARINIGTKGAYKTIVLLHALISNNHEKAIVLLENGALVNQFILDDPTINKDLQDLLQKQYDEQVCVICYEHPEDMEDIPCINRHPDAFICRKCYDQIAPGNKCPLDNSILGQYDTEFGKYRKRKIKPNKK